MKVTPIYVATPTFYSHPHKGFYFSMILVDFCIHDRELAFWGSKVVGCGRGLVGVTFMGMALASKASFCHAHKGHAPRPRPQMPRPFALEPQKANSRSIDIKMH